MGGKDKFDKNKNKDKETEFASSQPVNSSRRSKRAWFNLSLQGAGNKTSTPKKKSARLLSSVTAISATSSNSATSASSNGNTLDLEPTNPTNNLNDITTESNSVDIAVDCVNPTNPVNIISTNPVPNLVSSPSGDVVTNTVKSACINKLSIDDPRCVKMTLNNNNKELLGQIKLMLSEVKIDIINELNPRLLEIERRVARLEEPKELDPRYTIVITRMPYSVGENVGGKVQELLDVMGSHSTPAKVVRLKKKNDTHTPIIKAQFRSIDEKVNVLRLKSNLRKSARFRDVYLHSSFSQEELTAQNNLRTLMMVLPEDVKKVKMNANGRLTITSDGSRMDDTPGSQHNPPWAGNRNRNFHQRNTPN